MAKKKPDTQATMPETSQPGTPSGPLRFEITATPGKKNDHGLEWTMKAKLGQAYAPRHLEAAGLIGEPVRLKPISGTAPLGVRVTAVRHKLDKDGKVVVEIVTTGDAQSPKFLGAIVHVEPAQDALPGVASALEKLRPKAGSGIDSVTLIAGGESVTLKARGRKGR